MFKQKRIISYIVTVFGVILAVALVKPSSSYASEGIFQLRNQVGENSRCVAFSVLMQDLQYKILLSCRDIIYPGGTEVFSYVTWANPLDGGNPQRLGTLGLGKVEFSTKTSFSSLYVTKERNSNTRSPNGPVVMQGGLERINLLENPSAPESELGTPETSPIPTPQAKKSPLNIFRIGGAIAFMLLFLVILLVFVLIRR